MPRANKVHDGRPHKYQRFSTSTPGRFIWRCMLNECSHWVFQELILGRTTLCHRCGDPFVMDRKALSLKKPHCRKCTRGKSREAEKIEHIIEESPI